MNGDRKLKLVSSRLLWESLSSDCRWTFSRGLCIGIEQKEKVIHTPSHREDEGQAMEGETTLHSVFTANHGKVLCKLLIPVGGVILSPSLSWDCFWVASPS